MSPTTTAPSGPADAIKIGSVASGNDLSASRQNQIKLNAVIRPDVDYQSGASCLSIQYDFSYV